MPRELPPCFNRNVIAKAFPGSTMIPSSTTRAATPKTPERKTHANPGLVFDRYLRIWYRTRVGVDLNPAAGSRESDDPGKSADLEAFCDAYVDTDQEGKRIVGTLHRRLDALLSIGDQEVGQARTYTTRWRVVTGLGGDHPLENGFIFDRASGAPYFPGSSVKGLCRAAAKAVFDMSAEEQNELFGVEPELAGDADSAPATGRLVFLPAFPAKDHWPRLEVDVVNNHHPSYYRGLSEGRPGSRKSVRVTDSPVPVFFLTVASGTPFTFRICDREPQTKGSSVERGFQCLEAGLNYLGLGAKTAAGYGTFRVE